ncbi:MAG: hypothetical protein JO256_06080 [Alphaproteobacteria bacterium]|nr:hypothetical protein [Alphaproteobacteria bacterium]
MRFSLILPVLAALLATAVPAGAQGQNELYTVSGIHVDVTGRSSTEAFTNAIAGGRPQAFQILFRRLTQQKDWGRQPALDAAALTRLSRGYNVANERRSTTRYVADVTYIFSPDAVNRLLRGAGIAFTTQAPSARLLIIPMSPGVTAGGWANTLSSPAAQASAMMPYSLPSADELKAMTNLSFDNAQWSDVAAAAGRARAAAAALLQAVYARGKVTVNIRLLSPNQAPVKSSAEVAMTGTVGTAYPAAATEALAAIDDLWKARVTVDPNQRGRLTADMRIASLQQWSEAQAALAGVSQVTGITLVAMDTGYARMVIAYTGSADQLREALSAAHLSLTNRAGQWTLIGGG